MSHERESENGIYNRIYKWNGATICFLARRIFAFCGQNAERGE